VRLIAVIKADAYGLGAVPISEALATVVDEFA
jgi:alanine racemase